MTWIYVSMFRAARNNSARARQHSFNSNNTDSDVPEPTTPIPNTQPSPAPPTPGLPKRVSRTSCMPATRRRSSCGSQSFIFGEEWRAARTGAIILSSFFVCWFPFFATALSEPWIPEPYHVPSFVPPLVILLSLSASVINPYIYVFRNRTARKHIKKLFNCLRRGRRRTLGMSASQNIRGYPGSFSRSPAPGAMTSSFRDRTVMWRSMTVSQDGTVSTLSDIPQLQPVPKTKIRQNRMASLDTAMDEIRSGSGSNANLGGAIVMKVAGTARPLEEEILSVRSTDGILLLKMSRLHRDSTSDWNSSFDSNGTNSDDVRPAESAKLPVPDPKLMHHHDWLVAARPGSCYRPKARPPLKRSKTTIEEQEMALLAMAAQAQITRTGILKGKMKDRMNSEDSSEATASVGSSIDFPDNLMSSSSLHSPVLLAPAMVLGQTRTRLRPKLVRQCTAIIHYPETEEEEAENKETQIGNRWQEY